MRTTGSPTPASARGMSRGSALITSKVIVRSGRRLLGTLLVAATFATGACDGGAPVTSSPVGEKPVPTPEPVHSVVLSPIAGELEPGASVRLHAEPRDRLGRPLQRSVSWHSTRPEVASVSASGEVRAVGPGATRIYASSEGVSADVGIAVRAEEPPPPPPPAPVARLEIVNGAIVLEEDETESVLVRLFDAHGRVLEGRTVTFAGAGDGVATVTPYGTVRAERVGETRVVVSSEGREATAAVRVVARPSFGLLYDRVSPAGNELFSLTLGGMPMRLNAGNVSRHPSPSPDGRRLVFAVTQRDQLTGAIQHDLYVVDRTGLNMRRLTSGAGVESSPVWSPDGTRIAYAGSEIAGANHDIYVVNVDGSGIVNLTPNTPLSHEDTPAWSPDSRSLAFTSVRSIGGAVLQTVHVDGTGLRDLDLGDRGTFPLNVLHPTWSPDGARIAFARRFDDGDIDIAIVAATGGTPQRLRVTGDQLEPTWSPDGEHFVYHGSENGTMQVYTVRADGAAVRRRTNDPNWGGGRNGAWVRVD